MHKSYLTGLTTALFGVAAIAAATPALAGQAVPISGGQVAFNQTPCGGDFGLLGNIVTEQEAVTQANPTNAPVCN